MIREVRRSLNYYQSQQTEHGSPKPVSRIILSGGAAKMAGLANYFEHKLGVPVTCTGVFDNPRFLQASGEASQGLDLSVASGLALRAFAKSA